MSFEFDAPDQEELASDGGDWLKEPGFFHFGVTKVADGTTGESISGGGFKVYGEVLAGSVEGQEEFQHGETFFNGKASQKNNGAFARKKQTYMAIAGDLITPLQIGKKVSIELQDLVGRQYCMRVEGNDENDFLNMSFAHVYHVDDPRAKKCPKNEEALKLASRWRVYRELLRCLLQIRRRLRRQYHWPSLLDRFHRNPSFE